jgi:putative ABC transport system permease protein
MRGVFTEAFKAAFASLMAHRMRSFRTTRGILLGTA